MEIAKCWQDPGGWFITEFTMDQVETRIAALEEENAKLHKECRRESYKERCKKELIDRAADLEVILKEFRDLLEKEK